MQNHSDGLTAKQTNSASADWRQVVQRLLKAEMSKRGVKYQDLSERLVSIGVNQAQTTYVTKLIKAFWALICCYKSCMCLICVALSVTISWICSATWGKIYLSSDAIICLCLPSPFL